MSTLLTALSIAIATILFASWMTPKLRARLGS